MRRTPAIIVVVLFILVISTSANDYQVGKDQQNLLSPIHTSKSILTQVDGYGDELSASEYMSVTLINNQISILNTFASTEKHNGTLNLSDKLLSGWTLYQVTVDVQNITAALERKVVGVSSEAIDFNIDEHTTDYFYDQLAQGFYNQPYNGSLRNYSIYYVTPQYTPAQHNYAEFTIRSSYSDTSSNITEPVNVPDVDVTSTWANISTIANLTANTVYYAMIDGRNLVKVLVYPDIWWWSENSAGSFTTRRHDTFGPQWTLLPREAMLNYSYIPWNMTTNSSLVFSHPHNITLRANSTEVSDSSQWSFSLSNENITLINFDSNQSVYVNHNLTLWYKKSTSSVTTWNVASSESMVDWNATTSLSYSPSQGIITKYLNVTVPIDWTVTGLYNSTNLSSNYNNFTEYSTVINCVNMTNGTWTLTFTAHNYLTQLMTYISGTVTSLDENASIREDMDINSTIQDELNNDAINGTTNLTISHSGSTVYAPANVEVTQGHSHYLWNITEYNTGSGKYTIEVYWSNGTEAGYRSKEILIYYPTSLTAEEDTIEAYTDNSFNIAVHFDNITSGSEGLTSTEARVTYSYDGSLHQDMIDDGNGRWIKTIDTGGVPGSYFVEVNATGLGLENQTLIIDVELTYETNPLEIYWSDTNTITYVESTTLSVNYTLIDGTPIEDAEVNVTVGLETWDLKYDPVSEMYNITFNGTDTETGLGTSSLDISAWKADHKNQSLKDVILTINKEPTDIIVSWSNTDTITYIESTILIVNYTMSNGTSITGATLNVTFGTNYEDLLEHASVTYRHEFMGTDDPPGFGIHGLIINASKFGYEGLINSVYTLTIEEEPTTLDFEWTTHSMDWTQDVIFVVNYTDSNSDLIDSATQLDISVNGTLYVLHGDNGTYWIEFNKTFDLGYHSVEVTLKKYGYVSANNALIHFNITNALTTIQVIWEPLNVKIDVISKLNVTVKYNYSGAPVPSTAKINVTINSHFYELNYVSEVWQYSIPCSEIGIGLFDAYIEAGVYGYEWQDNLTQNVNITLAATTMDIIWSSQSIFYLEQIDLTVNYTYDRTGQPVPITGNNVNISIDGDTPLPLILRNGLWIGNFTNANLSVGDNPVNISVWADGYEAKFNDTVTLRVNEEITTIDVIWDPIDVHIDIISKLNVTVKYNRSTSPVLGASVNVTIGGLPPYQLSYSLGAWYGSIPCLDLGLGVYSADIDAWLYGYQWKDNLTTNINITLAATTLEVIWNSTSMNYLGQIDLTVNYTNDRTGQPVPALAGHVNISIDGQTPLPLREKNGVWIGNFTNANLSLGDNPVNISAWANNYETEINDIFTLSVTNVTTDISVTWNPANATIDYVNSFDITVEYTYGSIDVPDTAKVNVTIDTLVFPMSFLAESWQVTIDGDVLDIGVYSATIDAWLYGYQWATNFTPTVIVTEAATKMELEWNTTTINYLGAINLTVNYTYNGTGLPVLISGNYINITIDGSTNLILSQIGDSWKINLTGVFLDLGVHNVVIRGWEYGFVYQERIAVLTVNNVLTNLDVTWEPANVTIEFTDNLNLIVDYTFDSTDITTAEVNVSINGLERDLTFSSGSWRVSISGQDLGIGYYDAVISAWLYGYEHQTNITYGVNITLAANIFWVTWNPVDRNVTYIEEVSAAVNYTRDFIPVTGATVNLYLNGTGPYLLTYSDVDERYHITLSASVIDLGLWNATITANKTGYESQSSQSYLTVNQDIPIIEPSWSVDTTDYVSPKNLTVSVTDSLGTDIDDAIFSVSVAGTSPNVVFITNGEYNITLGPLLSLGIQVVNVTVSRWGYRTITLLLSLNVTTTETQGFFDKTSTTIFYDESVDLQISFQMLNSSYVPTGTCTVDIQGSLHSITWNVDHWEAEVLGNELGLGTYHCIIETSAYGYVTQTDEFDITVNPIPILVQLSANRSLYVNDTLQLYVTYHDARTDDPINHDLRSISWIGTYEWSEISIGNYSLILNSTGIHLGSYTLETLLEKKGYENDTMQWEIQVMSVLVDVIISAPQETWENETITVTVRLNDTVHGVWIHWANVTLTLLESNYSMDYAPSTNSYTKSLWLNDTLSPDSYIISISADAMDCKHIDCNQTLVVNQKITYSLTLTIPVNVTVGTPLVVQVNVTADIGSDAIAIPVTVYAEYIMNESVVDIVPKPTTTRDGYAEVSFTVDEIYDQIIVWAEFEGSIREWPKESLEYIVGVKPELSPLEALMVFFSDTNVQMAIIGIIMLGVIGATYTKVIRPRRHAEERVLERQLNTFRDLDAVRHFMAVYTTRGTCVYYHPFTESRIQPDLISGFITAITSVYGEITGEDGVVGTLEEIHYHGLRLNSFSGRYIIGILISEGDMTDLMRDRLQFFVEMFETEYESDLEGWVGIMDCFNSEWVVSNLNAAFNYHWRLPHRLGDIEKGKKNFKNIMKIIEASLDDKNEFLFENLLDPIAERFDISQAEALELLLLLDDLNIIHPISVHTVLQRSGLGIPGEEEEQVAETYYEEPSEVKEELVEPKKEKPKKKKKKEKTEEELPVELPPEEELPIKEVEETKKRKKKREEEHLIEPPPEEEVPLKEEEKFIAEVEQLLSIEEKEKPDTSEEKEPDELEKFVSDVEKLLTDEENDKSDSSD